MYYRIICIVVILFTALGGGLVAQNNTGVLVRPDSTTLKLETPDPVKGEAIKAVVMEPLSEWLWKNGLWYLVSDIRTVQRLWTDDGDGTISYGGRIDVQDIGVSSILNKYIINDNGVFTSINNIPSTDITGLEEYTSQWVRSSPGTTYPKTLNDNVGIKTTSAVYDLHIDDNNGANASFMVEGGSSSGYAWSVVRNNTNKALTMISRGSAASGDRFGIPNANNQFIYSTEQLAIGTFSVDDLTLGTNDTKRLTISSGGTISFADYSGKYLTGIGGNLGTVNTIPADDISLDVTNFDQIGTTYNDVQIAIQRINDLLGGLQVPAGTGVAGILDGALVFGGAQDSVSIYVYKNTRDFSPSYALWETTIENTTNGRKIGFDQDKDYMRHYGSMRYMTELIDTVETDNSDFWLIGSGSHVRHIRARGSTRKVVDGMSMVKGQEVLVTNESDYDMEFVGLNDLGSFHSRNNYSYILPPESSVYVKKTNNSSEGDDLKILEGTGYHKTGSPQIENNWFDAGAVGSVQLQLGVASDYKGKTGVKCDCSDVGDTLISLPDLGDNRVLTIHNYGSQDCVVTGDYTGGNADVVFGGQNAMLWSKRSFKLQQHGTGAAAYWSIFVE